MINRNTRQNENEYKNKRREVKQMFRKIKQDQFKIKLENIKTVHSNKEARKFYKEVNTIRKGFSSQTTLVKDKKRKHNK
jgi:hypothetical protein